MTFAGDLTFDTVDACRVCGSRHSKPWRRGARDMSGTVDRRFTYNRCATCRVAFLVDGPSPESAGAFYASNYGPYTRPSPAVVRLFIGDPTEDPLQRRLQQAYRLPRAGARLLDYGCGSAATLDAARDVGWSTTGADFAPAVLDAVRLAGHEAQNPDQALKGLQYDLIRANHVVEHLYDPVDVLRRMIAALVPGGRLHLATPNPDGIGSLVFRRHWFPLEAPKHIVLFPPSTLADLVQQAGAAEVELVHEHVTKDIARSVLYVGQELGVRIRDVQQTDGPRLVNRLLPPVVARAARSGRSDRYHLLARTPS